MRSSIVFSITKRVTLTHGMWTGKGTGSRDGSQIEKEREGVKEEVR